jgi:hypothetical protein
MEKTIQKGIVFDVKKYAVDDGPGIRTTIFLKRARSGFGRFICDSGCWTPEKTQESDHELLEEARNA